MERVTLEIKHVLYEPQRRPEYVFFPIDGVASLLAVMERSKDIEVATIGNEGMVGIQLFLGSATSAMRAFQQVPGEAWQMKASDFHREVRNGGALPQVLMRYTQALFTQIAQTTGCNRIHSIEERCARWLLMTHDRVSSDEFQLTHQFLGQMLGVRRATVTEVMGELQKSGVITYRRGRVHIVRRRSLEKVSCECYRIVTDEYARLLDGQVPH